LNNFKTELYIVLRKREEKDIQLMPSIEEQIVWMFTDQINHTQMLQIKQFIKKIYIDYENNANIYRD